MSALQGEKAESLQLSVRGGLNYKSEVLKTFAASSPPPGGGYLDVLYTSRLCTKDEHIDLFPLNINDLAMDRLRLGLRWRKRREAGDFRPEPFAHKRRVALEHGLETRGGAHLHTQIRTKRREEINDLFIYRKSVQVKERV